MAQYLTLLLVLLIAAIFNSVGIDNRYWNIDIEIYINEKYNRLKYKSNQNGHQLKSLIWIKFGSVLVQF